MEPVLQNPSVDCKSPRKDPEDPNTTVYPIKVLYGDLYMSIDMLVYIPANNPQQARLSYKQTINRPVEEQIVQIGGDAGAAKPT